MDSPDFAEPFFYDPAVVLGSRFRWHIGQQSVAHHFVCQDMPLALGVFIGHAHRYNTAHIGYFSLRNHLGNAQDAWNSCTAQQALVELELDQRLPTPSP